MRKCTNCGDCKPVEEFYRNSKMGDGYLRQCKMCVIARFARRYREKKREADAVISRYGKTSEGRKARVGCTANYRKKHPEKHAAHVVVRMAVRSGKLIRLPCEVCGSTCRVQAHHEGYSRPLAIRWLCFDHNRTVHGYRSETQPNA